MKYMAFLSCFLGGIIFGGNLRILLGTEGVYDASWLKLFLSVIIPLCFIALQVKK